MSMSQETSLRPNDLHLHTAISQCPVCDQPVPNEKLHELNARMEARERDLSTVLTTRLKDQFAQEIAKAGSKAKAELQRVRDENIAKEEQLKQEILTREAVAKAAGRSEAETAMQTSVMAADEAKANAEQELAGLKVTQQQMLDEQRSALEKAATDSLNAERAKVFEEKTKLESQLQDLTRQLQRKTAEELGEGAEVNLFEALKAEFEGDRIDRVGKGEAGADIIHDVIHNGKVCGRIVYDSKNRNAWRSDYVSKLLKDQVAAQADYAILSCQVFPSGTRQIHIQDNVIIINPARVLAVVELLRKSILQAHTLRLSSEDRAEKTAALYEFITSERFKQLLNQIEIHTADMLELEVKEKKAHDATWNRRGALIRGVQKAEGDLLNQIEIVLGTALDTPNVDS